MTVVARYADWPMTDAGLASFQNLDVPEQRLVLWLEDVNVDRLDFDRWRIAHGRDPEWSASSRKPLFDRCQCEVCQADPAVAQLTEFTAP